MTLAAVGQFCASSVIEANKAICCQLVKQAAENGAKMLFLPEASDFISESKEQAYKLTLSLEDSIFVRGLQQTAQSQGIGFPLVFTKSAIPTRNVFIILMW
ncbi:unnamed protein product [Absidia cylindrospora]